MVITMIPVRYKHKVLLLRFILATAFLAGSTAFYLN